MSCWRLNSFTNWPCSLPLCVHLVLKIQIARIGSVITLTLPPICIFEAAWSSIMDVQYISINKYRHQQKWFILLLFLHPIAKLRSLPWLYYYQEFCFSWLFLSLVCHDDVANFWRLWWLLYGNPWFVLACLDTLSLNFWLFAWWSVQWGVVMFTLSLKQNKTLYYVTCCSVSVFTIILMFQTMYILAYQTRCNSQIAL